jgi:adenine-specific DNA-methyltransferase
MARGRRTSTTTRVEPYKHPESDNAMRPEVGTQARFKKKKPPQTYRYDSSISPVLDWDALNPSREQGEALLARILEATSVEEAKEAAAALKAMSRPFLNWAGKAGRLSFDVPTLPLFVHERLSTMAIIETLKGHKSDRQIDMFSLFGDPQHSITDQVLRAYEHRDKWTNRMILGDSMVVMNSLLHYEGLGGQVQMIYMDPPYGVKFGSNFQPFVRKRDVSHNDDEDMTREPEMVQAYRDTWELGLHSYLTYLRDRLLLARELLTTSGSIFVQISDQNIHHVRETMDEVFGSENAVALVNFRKTTGAGSPAIGTDVLAGVSDYLLWYARNRSEVKYRQLYVRKLAVDGELGVYNWVELAGGSRRRMTREELEEPGILPLGSHIFTTDNLTSQTAVEKSTFEVEFEGRRFRPAKGGWKTSQAGMENLREKRRLAITGETLRYVRFLDDFLVQSIHTVWDDTGTGSFTEPKVYAVQTGLKVAQRCALMTTDPGDLILDPTCGSGTTAYAAEQWGRRWITIDTSRVPLALARQRLLTGTFPYYELNDESRGPAGGFVYKRKQNNKGEEVGGIVSHITLKSIANNEPPGEEVLVDRPEVISGITRVSGPFCFEATIPTPVDWDGDGIEDSGAAENYGSFVDRMLEVLRKSPVLRLEGNRTVTFKNVRPPTKSLSLSAEALVEATAPGQTATIADAFDEAAEKNASMLPLTQKPVAFVFGPENGAVSEKLVSEAAREAYMKSYTHLPRLKAISFTPTHWRGMSRRW